MTIVLFAIIGACIKAGVAYWICFSIFCVHKAIVYIGRIVEASK